MVSTDAQELSVEPSDKAALDNLLKFLENIWAFFKKKLRDFFSGNTFPRTTVDYIAHYYKMVIQAIINSPEEPPVSSTAMSSEEDIEDNMNIFVDTLEALKRTGKQQNTVSNEEIVLENETGDDPAASLEKEFQQVLVDLKTSTPTITLKRYNPSIIPFESSQSYDSEKSYLIPSSSPSGAEDMKESRSNPKLLFRHENLESGSSSASKNQDGNDNNGDDSEDELAAKEKFQKQLEEQKRRHEEEWEAMRQRRKNKTKPSAPHCTFLEENA